MYPSWHQISFGPNKGQYVRVYLEPGFRFAPEDHSLINDYLKKFINFEPIPYSSIETVNVYMYNPRNLTVAYPSLADNAWYFFTPRDRKRLYRAAGNGYWKCHGTKQQIYHNNIRIGYKNSLIFYRGKPPYGRETIWVMKEYIVDQPPRRLQDDDNGDIEDDYVLCLIQMRTGRRRHSRINKYKLLLSNLAKLSIRRRTYKFAAHKLRKI
ncbi:NAC domain-containing protein 1-like [Primulina huaijiensis]|uniref:NAC domain-containing protein 1-like n=1 Tax=Primulina huaijiensis TaxID=1492673 RepID=UPI003CC6E888